MSNEFISKALWYKRSECGTHTNNCNHTHLNPGHKNYQNIYIQCKHAMNMDK